MRNVLAGIVVRRQREVQVMNIGVKVIKVTVMNIGVQVMST